MRDNNREPTDSVALRGQLPLKITGIVFWCTVLIGLIMAMLQLQLQEQEMEQRSQEITNIIAADLALWRTEHPDFNDEQLREHISQVAGQHDIQGISVNTDNTTITVGSTENVQPLHPEQQLEAYLRAQSTQPIILAVYPPETTQRIIQERKKLLITMGLLFSAFGFVLQWILKRVITRPFERMVNTANQFTRGDLKARFYDKGNDEFSYLGGFFNEALDFQAAQQDELRSAMQRLIEAEVELFQEKEKAEVTLHSIGDGVVTTDRLGHIEYMNPAAETLTGLELKIIRGMVITDLFKLVDEESHQPVANPVLVCLEEGETQELSEHKLIIASNGIELSIANSAAPILSRNDEIIGAIMVFHDIGQARQLSRQLSYQASHDMLTGLYNRTAFENKLRTALESARQEDKQHAFFYLDLDQFKIVNDTCGHMAGDELLELVASILHSRLRESDILARLGGDEFGVLLHDCSLEDASRIANKLREGIHDFRFTHEGHSFEIGVSIGLVMINAETPDLTDIYANADMACYAAKDAGRNRIHVYEPDDRDLQEKRGEMRWLSQIQNALDNDRFMLLCQPIEPIDKASEDVHVEVLLRMLDDDDNLIPPMAFIPAAERYDVMHLLDQWVVNNLTHYIEACPRVLDGFVWNINLSGNSLSNMELLDHIVNKIRASKLPASRFCFEITETSAIARLGMATLFIERLRSEGCTFALDDFGSGLSSFGYLKNLGVQYLKIDGTFIRDILNDPVDKAMVEAIQNVGTIMNLKTIAEFVENDDILFELKEIGINYAQGFGIAKPLPLTDYLCAAVKQATGTAD